MPLVVGNYPKVGVQLWLDGPWGPTGVALSGGKVEWGAGGFEMYAADDHSDHTLTVEGVAYRVPMVPGKTSVCIW
jgi:hypothetical protein